MQQHLCTIAISKNEYHGSSDIRMFWDELTSDVCKLQLCEINDITVVTNNADTNKTRLSGIRALNKCLLICAVLRTK